MSVDRFENLLERYQSCAATSDELAELEQLLRADPLNRRQLFDRFLLEIHLRTVFAGILQPNQIPNPPAKKRGRGRGRRLRVGLALAAALLLTAGTWWLLSGSGPHQVPTPEVESGHVSVGEVAVSRIPTGWFDVNDTTAVIRLPDGTRAELDPTSKAAIPNHPAESLQVVELAQGGGTFFVAHNGGRFRVETPAGTVTALGTEFSVKLQTRRNTKTPGLKLTVAVTAGTVQVDAAGTSHRLTSGQSRVFGDDGQQNNNDDGQQNNRNNDKQKR